MSVFEKRLTIPVHIAIFALLVVLALTFFYLFSSLSPEGKAWASRDGHLYVLASGLVPGLVVAIIQYLLAWFEFRELSRLRGFKIKSILITRDDASYYGNLIRGAEKRIDLIGVTAYRFLEDFASATSPKDEKRVLTDALTRKVEVRILIADSAYLDEKQQQKAAGAIERLAELKANYSKTFDYRYYKHAPTHTLFRVDGECIVGPQFQHLPSKDTPAVHTVCDSTFAAPYLRYFDEEWDRAAQ